MVYPRLRLWCCIIVDFALWVCPESWAMWSRRSRSHGYIHLDDYFSFMCDLWSVFEDMLHCCRLYSKSCFFWGELLGAVGEFVPCLNRGLEPVLGSELLPGGWAKRILSLIFGAEGCPCVVVVKEQCLHGAL